VFLRPKLRRSTVHVVPFAQKIPLRRFSDSCRFVQLSKHAGCSREKCDTKRIATPERNLTYENQNLCQFQMASPKTIIGWTDDIGTRRLVPPNNASCRRPSTVTSWSSSADIADSQDESIATGGPINGRANGDPIIIEQTGMRMVQSLVNTQACPCCARD
jgi:hypothetical protein